MNYVFDTCHEAIAYATSTKSFGAFYSNKKDQNKEVHIHDCCEIFFCLEGGRSFLIDDKIYDINDGDLFIINQFEAHKVVPDDGDRFLRYILHLHPSFLYANSFGDLRLSDCFYSAERVSKTSLPGEEIQHLTELFESLKKEYPYGDEVYKRLRATEILLEINRIFSVHRKTSPDLCSHKTIQLAIKYINNHYASPLTLEVVAKNAFVSPTQLSRLFNRYCGTTVAKYIVSKRITEAKKLLSEGRSVTDTAFMCGFNDYANFIRSFKKAVGVPPGKYRTH